jgi:hypothetical protein
MKKQALEPLLQLLVVAVKRGFEGRMDELNTRRT